MATKKWLLASCFVLLAFRQEAGLSVSRHFLLAGKQLAAMEGKLKDSSAYPRSVAAGKLTTVKSDDWTSGFFPGSLWYLYEYTHDPAWKAKATRWSKALEKEQDNKNTHDLGFMLYCSLGNQYRLTRDTHIKAVLIKGAYALASRFDPRVGCIRSWDFNKDIWHYPVIIDNMMNLEYLFWAAKASGDTSLYHIAKTHALTTMRNHFRADYSSYHVVDYEPTTGQVRKKQTFQGYADESAWARGQAWGLYGFTVAYRETHDTRFLAQAKAIAGFILKQNNCQQSDPIPYWDYNAPVNADTPKDASAAAVMASAFLELALYAPNEAGLYRRAATRLLTALSSPAYFAEVGTNENFLLKHSTGHHPHGTEIDAPLNYADYYYLEALLRYQQSNK